MIIKKSVLYKTDLDKLAADINNDADNWPAERILTVAKEFVASQDYLFRSQRGRGTTISEQDLKSFWDELQRLYQDRGGPSQFPDILPPQKYTVGQGE
jgi:hypothetical protein